MKYLTLILFFFTTLTVVAQKKVLDHPDFEIWNTIQGRSIAGNGKYVMYSLERREGDNACTGVQ